MPLQYKKGKCDKCEKDDVFIVKKHPREGSLCNKCNSVRLRSKKIGLANQSESNTEPSQSIVFRMIWKERDHVSFVSGVSLNRYNGTKMWYSLFAHVLSKAQNKYPKFIVYKKNIVLLTPEEHHLFDHGSIDQREKYVKEQAKIGIKVNWSKLYELKEKLIEKYNEKHSN